MADETRTELILKTIVAAIDAPGKPTGLKVERERKQPVTVKELPLVAVYPVNEEPTGDAPRTRPTQKRALTVQVRIRVAGTSAEADPIRKWVHSQVMKDRSLGKLALGIADTRTTWDEVEGSDGAVEDCTTDYNVEFTTNAVDLGAAQ